MIHPKTITVPLVLPKTPTPRKPRPPKPPAEEAMRQVAIKMRQNFQKAILEVNTEFDSAAMHKEIVADMQKMKREVMARVLGLEIDGRRISLAHNSDMAKFLSPQISQSLKADIEEMVKQQFEADKAAIMEALRAQIARSFKEATSNWDVMKTIRENVNLHCVNLGREMMQEFIQYAEDAPTTPTP